VENAYIPLHDSPAILAVLAIVSTVVVQ